MAEIGLGVPRDAKTAIDLYKKAADQNAVAAEARLGDICLNGDLIPPDFGQDAAGGDLPGWPRSAGRSEAGLRLVRGRIPGRKRIRQERTGFFPARTQSERSTSRRRACSRYSKGDQATHRGASGAELEMILRYRRDNALTYMEAAVCPLHRKVLMGREPYPQIPSPNFRPSCRETSVPRTKPTSRPISFSITGRHGTRLKPIPS
jgi:hypothetical protein